MKRVNVHFGKVALSNLGAIKDKVRQEAKYWGDGQDITRADLIRLAVSKFYGLEPIDIHGYKDEILMTLKKLKLIKKI